MLHDPGLGARLRNPTKEPPKDFDLTCWYLNQRRVLDLVGLASVSPDLQHLRLLGDAPDLRRSAEQSVFKDALIRWLRANSPPTLGQLFFADDVKAGRLFTLFTNFYCRGLREVRRAVERNPQPIPSALAYARLDDLAPGWKVEYRFYHEHLTSSSAWSELSGQGTLFVLGAITDVSNQTVRAIPFVIGCMLPDFGLGRSLSIVGKHWANRLQIFPDCIDSFAAIRAVPVKRDQKDLALLRRVSELDVKTAFAEIIGEPTIPKDWGGEQSDLFSEVVVGGERIAAAFIFKGPAQFMPMTLAQLGKNGDQIGRLFCEPADILFLQHCHEVTPAVRGAMRAYAQQIGNPRLFCIVARLFCIVDGYDTLRILQAYGKCGFEKRKGRRTRFQTTEDPTRSAAIRRS